MIGQSLEQTRKDLRLMPTPSLMEYKKNPNKQAIDGMPLDMLAGLELSRRAQLQQEQMAKMAPNPQQMPTVVDSAAMGLAGMAQQPAPQMPGAPTQFQAAPQATPQAPPQVAPQAAPQAAPPPQQMAQAPQGAPPQQPQKLATGGIASLGDMQDARDQGGVTSLYGGGQPVQMMARGGIVAFKNNEDQPVDADMPATETGAAFGIYPKSGTRQAPRVVDNSTLPQRRAMENYVSRAPAEPESTDGPVKPSDLTVSQGSQPDLAALLKQMGDRGGRGGSKGGGFDPSKMQGLIDRYMKPTDQETAYQKLAQEQMEGIRNRPSPEVSEAERKRIIGEQFTQNQAVSKPNYDKMQALIDEERASTKERYADSASNARLRLGLGLLGSRAPGFGQALSEAATPALDYYDKAKELEAAANTKSRQADMDLTKARMSDEKGDRESAQRYFDSYQKNKRDAETYELQRSNLLLNTQKGVVDAEGKRERAGMGLQMALERAGFQAQLSAAQGDNTAMRNQLGLYKLLQGNQPKAPTLNEKLAVEKRVGEVFGNPASPEYQKYVGAAPNGKQLLVDLKNGRIKSDNSQLQDIVAQAKKRYTQDLMRDTRSSSGATSYDQAASDLLRQ